MNSIDFTVGVVLGILFYHVLIVRLLNNPRFQKVKKVLLGKDNDKR